MNQPTLRPWLLAVLTLGVALVPVWLAWSRFRNEAQRKDAQLFEATSGLAGERLHLIAVRHLNFFNILRNQLRSQPVPVRDVLRIPPSSKHAFPHLIAFGYASIQNGRTVLEWTGSDDAAPMQVGHNLAADARLAAVLDRASRMAAPTAALDSHTGRRAFVACAVGDGAKPRGFVVGWLDVDSFCRDSSTALLKDGVLTAAPLAENAPTPPDAHLFMIREGDMQFPIAIARGPAFRETYGHISPALVLAVGAVCALLLAFLVFQGTRTVQLRASLDAERMRARLVQGFSHEFRTPLSVILTSTDLLSSYLEKLDPARRNEIIAQIHDSAQRMSEMVDEILLLSRLESARITPQTSRVDLAELCTAAAREITTATRERNCIEVNASGATHTDPALLRGALANLLSNAVKYSAPGATIRLYTQQRDGMVMLAVSDHGIGIPADDLLRIGEAFHRASNVGDITGTGLGLAIVRRSAALLGGTFAVQSEEGRGTTATLTLPAA